MNFFFNMYLRSLEDIQVEISRGQEAECHCRKNPETRVPWILSLSPPAV